MGAKILKEWSVPQTNLFSFTAPDFPTQNHHWLGEVFLYLGSIINGLKGLIIFKALVLTGALALAFFAFTKKDNWLLPVLVGLNSIFILIDRTYVRPEIFSFLFMGWYLFVLFRKDSKKLIFTLPFIQLIWVNTHIYYFIGPILYLFFFIQHYIDTRSFKLKDRFLLTGLVIGLVNLINPAGWLGAMYPLFIFNDYAIPILENLPIFKLWPYNYPALAIWALGIGIAISLISFVINRKNLKNNIFGLGMALFGIIMSIIMVRNMPIFALIMIPVNIKNFYEAGFILRNKTGIKTVFFGIGLLLLVLIQFVLNGKIYEASRYGRAYGLIVPEYGEEATKFIRDNNLHGPIFNNINTGSYLIWKLPEEKVFVDTRPEAYPANFIKDEYIAMQKDSEKWDILSEKYNINMIFYTWVEANYTDWANIFLKNIPENSGVIDKYKIDANYK